MGLQIQPKLIPDKAYFKIGEVCELTGIKSHTLRYWETEFTVIRPKRAGSKQRLYRRVDVENILKIKNLIHDQGFTLAGTRKYLARNSIKQLSPKNSVSVRDSKQILQEIKKELIAIKQSIYTE